MCGKVTPHQITTVAYFVRDKEEEGNELKKERQEKPDFFQKGSDLSNFP